MQRRTEVWILAMFGAVILLGVAAASFFSGSISPNADFKATQTSAIDAADHARGAGAKVTLVEYGDFQCPACAQYEPLVGQLMQKYGDRVTLVFRHFPLYQIHPLAMISAQASEAAALQGKFWEMHDLLYEKQGEWTKASERDVVQKYFEGYARTLGLDVAKFTSDIASDDVKARVQRDVDSANAAQVDRTPTFFLNLTKIQNPSSYAELESVVEAALASSTPQ